MTFNATASPMMGDDRRGVTRVGLLRSVAVIAVVSYVAAHVSASVVEYTDFGAWSAAVGTFTTLDFTDLSHNEPVDQQYAELGLTFGNTAVGWHNAQTFPLDGSGIRNYPIGASLPIEITFAALTTEVAVHGGVSGAYLLRLYSGQELIHIGIVPGSEPFLGVSSAQPFDRVSVAGLLGPTGIDNLYFGQPIPAPGAAVLLLSLAWRGSRRRRVR